MAVADYNQRPASYTMVALEDRFEVIKEIGDGSFGSVHLARVRANGASVARRNTMVSEECRPPGSPTKLVCRSLSRR